MEASRKPVRAILFDAGGTLIHLDGERICRAAGVDIDAVAFGRAAAHGAKEMGAWIRTHPESTDAERLPRFLDAILERLGIGEPDRRRAAAKAVAAEHARANLWSHAEAGAAETLAELRRRGYRVGVVSNADGRVRGLLASAGLLPHLEVVIDSSEVGVEKPDPRIFVAATDRLGVPPADCVYVGDIYAVDVLGARAAGMRAILIGPGEAESDVERISGLSELLNLFPARDAPGRR